MQKWIPVKGSDTRKGSDIKNKAKNASVLFEERKMQIHVHKCKNG